MILGSAQPLTETSTRYISWGVKTAGGKADNLAEYLNILGASASQNLSTPVHG